MVAIGLHVNWSMLDVCVSKCRPMFAGGVCGGGGGARQGIYRHTGLLPCGQEMQTCDEGRVSLTGLGGARRSLWRG